MASCPSSPGPTAAFDLWAPGTRLSPVPPRRPSRPSCHVRISPYPSRRRRVSRRIKDGPARDRPGAHPRATDDELPRDLTEAPRVKAGRPVVAENEVLVGAERKADDSRGRDGIEVLGFVEEEPLGIRG